MNPDESGGGILIDDASPRIAECLIYGNSTLAIDYSNIEDTWPGTGNIDSPALFFDAEGPDNDPGTLDDNLRLQCGSPSIDTGDTDAGEIPDDELDLDNDSNTSEPTPDLDLTDRIFNERVDMGAYECVELGSCPSDIDGNGATDVLDLLTLLGEWVNPPPYTADIAPDCLDGIVNVVDLLALLGHWGPCTAQGSESPPSSVGECLSKYSDPIEQTACIEMLIYSGQL